MNICHHRCCQRLLKNELKHVTRHHDRAELSAGQLGKAGMRPVITRGPNLVGSCRLGRQDIPARAQHFAQFVRM